MRLKSVVLACLLLWTVVPAGTQTDPRPPVAAKKPHSVKAPFGAERQDLYYWLRDDTRTNADVLEYLKAENGYADAVLAASKPLADMLYKEIVSRIKQDDASAPYRERGYYYYTRFETGKDYPIVARRKSDMEAPEQIMLDQSKMAERKDFFAIGDLQVSQDNRLLAYAEDTVGRRQYVLKIKNLETGGTLDDSVTNVEPNVVWADDGRTIFYIEKDPVTLLGKRVKAHVLGAPASADRLVYEEKDDSFYMELARSTSDKFICIMLQSTVSNEQRCTSASSPSEFRVISPRKRDFLYQADHLGGRWIIRTNWRAPNYRLMTVDESRLAKGRGAWRDLVKHRSDVFIEQFKPFDGFLAIEERSGGLKRIRTLTDDGKSDFVEADEPVYAMSLARNEEHDTAWVRYTYNSLITPETTYEVNALTRVRRVLKIQPYPGYDPSQYVTERVWATARDGVKIPVSLAYRKGFERDGKAAMLQYGYGSYGVSLDPALAPALPSMLDRGLVYAVAHVRGGQEMGRQWYDDGHLLRKKTSFTDFVDVTRHLVRERYAAATRVAAMGGSAGGLLMGAIANMAPEDYRVIIAHVPFVDIVTTMLDPSIPLTTNEYDEWGNPEKKKYYDYMLSYSPYDNVAAQAYPALFVGTGLWDSQVQYYEPAKWVAKLRATKTDNNPLVLRTNMEAGHGGKSGRFRRFHEQSEYYGFMLHQLGVERNGVVRP
jgi:oligopeptidase B